jgi:hypothetical protein
MIKQYTADARPKTNSTASLLVFAFLSLAALSNLYLLWVVKDKILAGYGDFAHFYASSLLVREGRGSKLYDYGEQREVQRALFSQVDTRPEPLVFNHLAYETLIYLPFTYFSYPVAVSLWTLINLFILIAISLYLPRRLYDAHAALRTPWILPMLAFFPTLGALIQGQDSVLLLLLYTFAFILLRSDKPVLAGCVLAMGLFKFHLILPFILIFLLRRQWRFVYGFAAACPIPLLLSVCVTGWRGAGDYIRFLVLSNQSLSSIEGQQQFGVYPANMPNVRGLVYTAFNGSLTYKPLLSITLICSAIVILWAVKAARGAPVEMLFALALMVTLLVSYHMFPYDLTPAILPAFLLFNQIVRVSRQRFGFHGLAFAISCALLLMSPLHLAILHYGIAGSVTALPVLVLALLMGSARYHSPASAEGSRSADGA